MVLRVAVLLVKRWAFWDRTRDTRVQKDQEYLTSELIICESLPTPLFLGSNPHTYPNRPVIWNFRLRLSWVGKMFYRRLFLRTSSLHGSYRYSHIPFAPITISGPWRWHVDRNFPATSLIKVSHAYSLRSGPSRYPRADVRCPRTVLV